MVQTLPDEPTTALARCSILGLRYATDLDLTLTLPHERERDQFDGDLPHIKARKDLSDEFKQKMLCDIPVRFYRLGEGDIAAARKAKGN